MESEYNVTCKANVISSLRLSPGDMDEVRVIELRIDEPAFRFHEGQSIGVLVEGTTPFGGKPHHRYYSIANAWSDTPDDAVDIQLIVRRCFYNDEFTGERYPGIASNYLCDRQPGDSITITGPYKSIFSIPREKNSNLLMIGTGTGIAPFRAFIQHIYARHKDWEGKLRLFFGDKSGLDLSYLNDVDKDLANYYTEETFKAYQSLSQRYLMNADEALEQTMEDHAQEAWEMIQDAETHVYIAGSRKNSALLDRIFAEYAGSYAAWQQIKEKLQAEQRWSELIYS